VSNHADMEREAARFDVRFEHIPVPRDGKQAAEAALLELLGGTYDLIVLARYMQILPARIIARYPSRIINIHPSLLPYHPGSNAYKQAWEEGVRVSGCTAHFVTEQLDAGPVILQDVFHIRVGEDTLEEVKERGRDLEGRVLSQAVQLCLNDQLVVKDKKVIFRPGRFPGTAGGGA
jgi:formyltetrahydrofolate deformylase